MKQQFSETPRVLRARGTRKISLKTSVTSVTCYQYNLANAVFLDRQLTAIPTESQCNTDRNSLQF